MAWVWDHSPYEGAKLLVHLALADYTNSEGRCWPSQASLARRARCSERWVREALDQMIVDKLLKIEADAAGPGKPRRYRLLGMGELTSAVNPELSSPDTGTLSQKYRNPTSWEPNKNHQEPRVERNRAERTCPLGLCGGSFVVEQDDGSMAQCECVRAA